MRLMFDGYILDVARRELRRGVEPIAVEPQVFDVLLYLVRNPDRVISKDELLQAIWDGRIVSDSAITNRINAARRAIGDSGAAQRLIRTVPRKGFRFVGAIEEFVDEPTQPPDVPHLSRRRGVAPALMIAAASALLGAALAAFVPWPTAGLRWPWAARPDSGRLPIAASAGDLRLMSGLSLPALSKGTDQLPSPAGLIDMAGGLARGKSAPVTSRVMVPVHLTKATAGTEVEPSGPEVKPLVPPDVTATATPVPNVAVSLPRVRSLTAIAPAAMGPLYPRDASKPFERYSYVGRDRVDEDKFLEVPCAATHIASSAGGKCLLGYREPGCNKAIDVVVYNAGGLSVEASASIFDPYKLAGARLPGRWCSVAGQPAYDQEDFEDMNQVTRRGSNWHNLLSNGEDKSIQFSDGPHNCVAVHKPGPAWQGGYVYMLHASICRTDTAAVRTPDVVYALNLLQIRQDDPVANLRTAGR
jgi:DNA-binding winged helix-turn-helix (wHTH) protein